MEPLPKATAEILIVEDEIAHAEAMEEGLGRMGHRCTVAHDGETGTARLLARPFDIVVTDLRLGGEKSGLDVLAAAQQHCPAAKVILITAHASIDTCRSPYASVKYPHEAWYVNITPPRTGASVARKSASS